MAPLIPIDGRMGEGGGQILRSALTLAAATRQGFTLTHIRSKRSRPGLRPQHLAAVRAATLACEARVGSAFEGSEELRFEPAELQAGDFRFEIATAGSTSLVLQTVLPALAGAERPSRIEVTGGTHVPASPSFDFLARHWASTVSRLGLEVELGLKRAGFYPPGGGEVWSVVRPWGRPASSLALERRGALQHLRGISGAGRLKGDVAKRQRDAAQALLWEQRRIEVDWQVLDVPAASPGSFILIEAIFEQGRCATSLLGERRLKADLVGERAARSLLRLLEAEGAVDGHLADQLAVPLALGGRGGRVSTVEVTSHLETVAEVLRMFGIRARTWGRRGGPGGLEVEAVDPQGAGD